MKSACSRIATRHQSHLTSTHRGPTVYEHVALLRLPSHFLPATLSPHQPPPATPLCPNSAECSAGLSSHFSLHLLPISCLSPLSFHFPFPFPSLARSPPALALELLVAGSGGRVVGRLQLALLLAVVPAQTLVQRVEPVGDLVRGADGRHREHRGRHPQAVGQDRPVGNEPVEKWRHSTVDEKMFGHWGQSMKRPEFWIGRIRNITFSKFPKRVPGRYIMVVLVIFWQDNLVLNFHATQSS